MAEPPDISNEYSLHPVDPTLMTRFQGSHPPTWDALGRRRRGR